MRKCDTADYVQRQSARREQVHAALFVNAHSRHGLLRATFTRGLLCSCGDAEYPGSGPRGAALAPNRWPRSIQ